MAYDAAKAHEYYMKYRKKGLKKGRKKGTKKKASTKQTNLVGLSSAGLNDAGKMQAALIRENIKKEMNAALAKETDPAKREAIRQEYQNRALSEISKLKNNSQYAQAKKASTKSGKGSGKSAGSAKSGSKSSGSTKTTATKTDNSAQRKAAIETATKAAQEQVEQIFDKIRSMSPDEKKVAKEKVQSALAEIEQIRDRLKKTTNSIREIYG